jgi:Flp pilus assembly protein TadG
MLMRTLRRFAAARSGVAAIEFALILPVMLVLLIGAVQMTDYVICSQKVANLANTAADLVTQNTAHDDTAMANVWNALSAVAYPYDAGSIKAVVSGLAHGDKTGEIVSWSIQHGGGVQHPVNSRMIVPDGISAVGTTLVVAEIAYTYKPLLGGKNWFLPATIVIKSTFYAAPRYKPVL